MTIWLAAIIALVPALAFPVATALSATANARLTAIQLAAALTTVVLMLMSFAFDQTSFVDLALCLTLLSVPGTLLMALFYERWL